MFAIIIIGPLLLIAVLWWLLERRESRRAAEGMPRHSGGRLFLAAAAILTALFTGGCSLLFSANADGIYVNAATVAVIGGIPFVGAALWSWVAMARQTGLRHKLAALAATFITAFYGVALWSLSVSGGDPMVPGLALAAVVTGAVALLLFLRKNPGNPPGP